MSPRNPFSAIPTVTAPPMPSDETDPYFDSRPPLLLVPEWIGYVGIVLFAGIVVFQFYSALMHAPREIPYSEVARRDTPPQTPPRRSPKASGTESSATAAAPSAEEALYRFTAMNTLRNKRGSSEPEEKSW